MYLELDQKFYEIVWTKGIIYTHYGKIPSINRQIPFGRFNRYDFKDRVNKKSFYNKKINEKIKKGYKIIKNGTSPSHDMKEMISIHESR